MFEKHDVEQDLKLGSEGITLTKSWMQFKSITNVKANSSMPYNTRPYVLLVLNLH